MKDGLVFSGQKKRLEKRSWFQWLYVLSALNFFINIVYGKLL